MQKQLYSYKMCIFALIMIAAGVSSLKRQLTISVCLANEAPFSASSFEGNPQHLTHTDIIAILATIIPYQEHIIRHYADKCNGG